MSDHFSYLHNRLFPAYVINGIHPDIENCPILQNEIHHWLA